MYKPPQNCNRVKLIKNKFENIENQKVQCSSKAPLIRNDFLTDQIQTPIKRSEPLRENSRNNHQANRTPDEADPEVQPSTETAADSHQVLTRQLSDPLKRNIKRTPAFRVDKNSEKACGLQRNCYNRSTLFENKVKQFNSVKTCDIVEKSSNKFNGICEADVSSGNGSSNKVKDSDIGAEYSKTKVCDNSDSSPKYNLSFLHSKGSNIQINNLKTLNFLPESTSSNFNFETSSSNSCYKTECQSTKPSVSPSKRPVLLKSKSSHDFQYIRSKFNKESLPLVKDLSEFPPKNAHISNITQNQVLNTNITPTIKNRCSLEQKSMKHLEKSASDQNRNDTKDNYLLKNVDLSLLYTEPIPKSLRNKNPSESSSTNESPLFKPKIENIYTKSTLQLTDSDRKEFLESLKQVLQQDLPEGLTDTLKSALNKPLPDGPAPRKPPRTFQHCINAVLASNLQKNPSFLHIVKEVEKKLTLERRNGTKKCWMRGDPKYMLNKLEMALKNNKLRARKQQKVEVSTTSGEDSDDSLLFRSKSSRSLPKPPANFEDTKAENFTEASDSLLGDLNCFSTFGCANPAYERIKEPNSSFFVGREKDPIYAEPIQSRSNENDGNGKSNRNSLYYMSTALITEETKQSCVTNGFGAGFQQDMDHKIEDARLENGNGSNRQVEISDDDEDETAEGENGVEEVALDRGALERNATEQEVNIPHVDGENISAENSSLSSFTSDLDSNPSPVSDDPHAKIRFLIENFETRRQTLPKVQKLEKDRQERVYCSSDSTSRVEVLRNSLKMTLDRTFSSDVALSSPKDSDSEKNEEGKVARMVAKFKTFQKSAPKYQQPRVNKDTLFYCCLIIERVQDCTQIKFKFPPHVEFPRNIEELCFPENPDSPPLEGTSAAQTYTLVITSETGDRTFGYCRRVLPEGSTHFLPLAYCILSKYRAPRFYKKLLIELESRHGMQNKYRDELISQFYHRKFPKPGESITINISYIEPPRLRDNSYHKELEESLDLTSFIHVNKTGEYGTLGTTKRTAIFVSEKDIQDNCLAPSYVAYEGNKTELVLTLHPDTRYEDADLKRLHKLPPDILLKIFSSLLLERKVVLISSVISELSSCVDSLQSILYPFTWYHTFIPILPESLWDIVESPTPVVCGVLSTEAVEDRRIENGIVVDLDEQSVLSEEGDEMKILSGSLHKVWRQFITLANNTKSREYVYSVYLADAYLYVFICCFKNYKQYVVNGQFLKDKFIENSRTKGIKRFLRMFTETCMFHAFIDAALNNPESLVQFDKKIELYGSDESRIILDKLLDWNR